MDPSDVLLLLCGREFQESLATLVLDYQGGGIIMNPNSVKTLERAPSPELQEKMKQTAFATLEAIEELDDSTVSHGIAHAVFVTSLWDSLKMSHEDILPIHSAISGGTISAVISLLQNERVEDAIFVTLLGQCLYMNAVDWHESRQR